MFRALLFCVCVALPHLSFADSKNSPKPPQWGEELAQKFVQLSLTCVDQEFPNYWERFEGKIKPRERHPVFFGCLDWHSSVHSHWAMLKFLKLFPSNEDSKRVTEILDKHFSPELLAGELKFLQSKPAFENPYGYGWFFRLLQELDDPTFPKMKEWRARFQPIADLFVERYISSLDLLNRPSRVGTHDNTAFAMVHILDYAQTVKDQKLLGAIQAKAKEFFGSDKNCPFEYEPGPYDFISPCLIEADLMRRVLSKKDFNHWQEGFFGKMSKNSSILIPVIPKDIKDPYLGHQIGLMFQKAASMEAISAFLPNSSKTGKLFAESARTHANKGIELMFNSGYGGTHWLASFAIFYFSGADLSVFPSQKL